MADIDVTTLTPVNIRAVWPDEAADFTPWLGDNLHLLGQALGLDLELVETEAPTGSFSLDVLATDTGRRCTVIIENQLDRSDHDHLGKVLIYASGHNADVAVWISGEMRDEHRQAIDWLNQRTGADTEFYGVEVRAVRIDGSRPACLFDVVARPNETRKAVVDRGRPEQTEDRERNRLFWEGVLDQLRDVHGLTNRRNESPGAWQGVPSEIPWIRYNTWFGSNGQAFVQLGLESEQARVNKELFDRLFARKTDIEGTLGVPVDWERRDNTKYSCLSLSRPATLDDSEEALNATREWMVDSVVRFSQKVMPLVKTLAAEITGESSGADGLEE